MESDVMTNLGLHSGTVAADLFVGIRCKDARIQYVVAE